MPNPSFAELALALEVAPPFVTKVGWCELEHTDLSEIDGVPIPSTWGDKRRREFCAGRLAARAALGKWGAQGEVGRDPDGVPLFPLGLAGSITHTGRSTTRAFALVAAGSVSVGIDAEDMRELEADLCSHILDESELQELQGGPKPLGLMALGAFSAKESFYKCVFPGRRKFIGFHDVLIQILPRAHNHWDCTLTLKADALCLQGVILMSESLLLSAVWARR